MDVWVEFKNASKWQAELLFTNFFSEVEEELRGASQVTPPTAEEIAAMEKEFAFLEAQQANAAKNGVTIQKATFEEEKISFVPKDGSIPSSMAGVEAMVTAVEEAEGGASGSTSAGASTPLGVLPPPVLERPSAPLGPAKIAALARQFGNVIPDGEHSVASLQGYLLRNKSRPEAAVLEAADWVVAERDLRSRLKREREERDAKMAIEREKRRKEREEAKRRADRDELRREREEQARIRKEDEEFAAEERKLAEERRAADAKAIAIANGTWVEPTPAPVVAAATDAAAATPVAVVAAPVAVAATPVPAPTPVAVTPAPAPTPAPEPVVATPTPAPAAVPAAEPVAAGTVTPAESVSESEDGQTPGAASIVLVRPEPEAVVVAAA